MERSRRFASGTRKRPWLRARVSANLYCRINRARVPVAKACAGASATDLSLGVYAAGRADR